MIFNKKNESLLNMSRVMNNEKVAPVTALDSNTTTDADNYYELTPEYDAYANYFYGKQTAEVEEAFDRAWLAHIHANPHHWQHWVLHNDEDGTKILDMPYVFIIEMICDHWSFSWRNNNLYNIFDWYDKNKKNIMFSKNTRKTYEHILSEIRRELDAENGTNS